MSQLFEDGKGYFMEPDGCHQGTMCDLSRGLSSPIQLLWVVDTYFVFNTWENIKVLLVILPRYTALLVVAPYEKYGSSTYWNQNCAVGTPSIQGRFTYALGV